MRNMSDQIESAPDLFMRRTYLPLLISARERIAKLIGATSTDEVVLVPSASQGVDLVLWNIDWEDGDVILMCALSPFILHHSILKPFIHPSLHCFIPPFLHPSNPPLLQS